MIRQKKTTLKAPWDPVGFKMVEIKGLKVKLKRGEETKTRAENHIKVIEDRPRSSRSANKSSRNSTQSWT